MNEKLYTALGLLLAGISCGLGAHSQHRLIRNRRSETSLDTLALRLENVEILLFQEQRKNRQLHTEISKMKTENLLQQEARRTEQSDIRGRLAGIAPDTGTCGCPTEEAFGALTSRMNVIEEGLRREKTSLRGMENVLETVKTRQEDFLTHLGILKKEFLGLQVNVSNIVSHCNEEDEVGGEVDGNTEVEMAPIDDKGNTRACPTDFVKLKTGCYYFQWRHPWFRNSSESADKECERRDATLVSVETVEERDVIQQHLMSIPVENIYLGFQTSGKRIGDEWKWVRRNNEQWTIRSDVLSDWMPGQPSGPPYNSLYFYKRSAYQWADVNLFRLYGRVDNFICEK